MFLCVSFSLCLSPICVVEPRELEVNGVGCESSKVYKTTVNACFHHRSVNSRMWDPA